MPKYSNPSGTVYGADAEELVASWAWLEANGGARADVEYARVSQCVATAPLAAYTAAELLLALEKFAAARDPAMP